MAKSLSLLTSPRIQLRSAQTITNLYKIGIVANECTGGTQVNYRFALRLCSEGINMSHNIMSVLLHNCERSSIYHAMSSVSSICSSEIASPSSFSLSARGQPQLSQVENLFIRKKYRTSRMMHTVQATGSYAFKRILTLNNPSVLR